MMDEIGRNSLGFRSGRLIRCADNCVESLWLRGESDELESTGQRADSCLFKRHALLD